MWHPDRFTSDPRLQGVAEEKLKEITQAYEALSGDQRAPDKITDPFPTEAPPLGARSIKLPERASWFKTAAFSGLFLALWFLIGSGLSSFVTPSSERSFMNQEALRIARLFGPEPAIAPDGSDGLGVVPARARRKLAHKTPDEDRPPNGADLVTPRGNTGLGELHIRNDSEADCVVRVVRRESPGAPLRVVYVRAGQESTIGKLQPDIYRLRVAFGRDLDASSLGFLKSETDDYWVGPFEFFQVESSQSRHGVRYNIVLKPPAFATLY